MPALRKATAKCATDYFDRPVGLRRQLGHAGKSMYHAGETMRGNGLGRGQDAKGVYVGFSGAEHRSFE